MNSLIDILSPPPVGTVTEDLDLVPTRKSWPIGKVVEARPDGTVIVQLNGPAEKYERLNIGDLVAYLHQPDRALGVLTNFDFANALAHIKVANNYELRVALSDVVPTRVSRPKEVTLPCVSQLKIGRDTLYRDESPALKSVGEALAELIAAEEAGIAYRLVHDQSDDSGWRSVVAEPKVRADQQHCDESQQTNSARPVPLLFRLCISTGVEDEVIRPIRCSGGSYIHSIPRELADRDTVVCQLCGRTGDVIRRVALSGSRGAYYSVCGRKVQVGAGDNS